MADFQGWGIIVFSLIISTIILRTILRNRTKSSLPPGPFRLPIIGHLHLLAPIPHQALHKLSIRYGPLMHISLGSNPCVIVSSPQMAKEFLKTHEASLSDRPQTVASMHLSYNSQDFMFAPYGPYWKFVKKLFMSDLLGGQTLDLLQTVRRYEIQSMINVMFKKSLAGEAVNVGGELIRLTNNVISSMVMRKRSESEEEAGEVRKLIKEVFETSGIFNLSDFIWFCKNLDLQGVKKRLVDVRGRYDKMMDRIIEEHRHLRMKKKEGGNEADAPSKDFLDILLDLYEDESLEIKLSIDKIKAIVLDMFTAGTDTSASVIEWTLAELINHPSIMERARLEIDTVVGKSRLVEESDLVNLPYLQAIVKETLRLHPSGPLIPRQASEGFTIGNYYIPAGTRIFVNVWALGRDPSYWENALVFKPERFIISSENETSGKGQLDVRGQHFHLLPFGSGRRGCPGATLALKIVQTTIAAIIQCFEWNVVGNEAYKSITPVNMEESKAITLSRAHPLICVPVARLCPFPTI
ncbi:cytochrome P450 93A3-like [Apium graveolens]|uniref:cytochrome P450 93A3-like n=1 Tax=Apium graveolens TaxID=4045 RepID=UPI003D7A723B